MIRSLAGLVLANACFFAAGLGIVRLLGWRLRRHLGIAYMAGIGTVGVLSTLLLLAGLALQWWEVLVLCALLASLGLVPREREEDVPPRPAWRIALPAGGLLGGYLVVLFVQCLYQPLNTWDAWSDWTMKARALVLLGGLKASLFGNHAYASLHLDYPVLMPAVEAIDFHFMGRLDPQVIHVQFWLLLAGFLVALYELLRDRVPQTLLWPTLLVIGIAPGLVENLTSGDADMPVAIFFSLAAAAAWRHLVTGERRSVWLFALMAGAALATKVEGEVFVGTLFVLLLVFVLVTRRPLIPLAAPLGWCLISIVPWQIWISRHGIHSVTPLRQTLSPSYLSSRTDRIGPWLHWLVRQAVNGDWLAILPIAAAVGLAVLILRRGWPQAIFPVAVIVAIWLGLTWGYVARPLGIEEILQVAGRRTLSTLILVAAVFLPVLGAALSRAQPSGEQRPASARAWWPSWRSSTKAARNTAASP
ncbi:MAG: hypothetical protein ACRDLM_06645 [Gaiellaceae bacterium]